MWNRWPESFGPAGSHNRYHRRCAKSPGCTRLLEQLQFWQVGSSRNRLILTFVLVSHKQKYGWKEGSSILSLLCHPCLRPSFRSIPDLRPPSLRPSEQDGDHGFCHSIRLAGSGRYDGERLAPKQSRSCLLELVVEVGCNHNHKQAPTLVAPGHRPSSLVISIGASAQLPKAGVKRVSPAHYLTRFQRGTGLASLLLERPLVAREADICSDL